MVVVTDSVIQNTSSFDDKARSLPLKCIYTNLTHFITTATAVFFFCFSFIPPSTRLHHTGTHCIRGCTACRMFYTEVYSFITTITACYHHHHCCHRHHCYCHLPPRPPQLLPSRPSLFATAATTSVHRHDCYHCYFFRRDHHRPRLPPPLLLPLQVHHHRHYQ